jgi:hypothetical protein
MAASTDEAWIPDTLRSFLAHAAGNDGVGRRSANVRRPRLWRCPYHLRHSRPCERAERSGRCRESTPRRHIERHIRPSRCRRASVAARARPGMTGAGVRAAGGGWRVHPLPCGLPSCPPIARRSNGGAWIPTRSARSSLTRPGMTGSGLRLHGFRHSRPCERAERSGKCRESMPRRWIVDRDAGRRGWRPEPSGGCVALLQPAQHGHLLLAESVGELAEGAACGRVADQGRRATSSRPRSSTTTSLSSPSRKMRRAPDRKRRKASSCIMSSGAQAILVDIAGPSAKVSPSAV